MSIREKEIIEIVRDYHYDLDNRRDFGVSTNDAMKKIEKLVDLVFIPGKEKERRKRVEFKNNLLETLSQLYDDIREGRIHAYSIETKIPPQECFLAGTGRMGVETGPDQFITIHTSRKENV